ncbi:unnamed protein product [Danaus chrysippus]|uniref:(African queen) hypothetical protein n=1 Tax=Danaus chrysippus TaxID=151541 RepID=A0A8J2W782_9NEOP|nr:unnamed protein product [Danaus chrysippus]
MKCKQAENKLMAMREKLVNTIIEKLEVADLNDDTKSLNNYAVNTTQVHIEKETVYREDNEENLVKKSQENKVIKTSESNLYEFDETDPSKKRVVCKLCQRKLSMRSLWSHITRRHPGADDRRVKCELCDDYILREKMNRHKILMHGDKYRCRYCKTEFDGRESLVEHVVTCCMKKRRKSYESSREMCECEVCHKRMQRASLKVHKAVKHSGLKPVCEHCGRCFGNKLRLEEHNRSKHGYEKFKCSTCDFQSASKLAMKNHERRHRGEKPFVCEACGASFHASYLLQQHKQSHRIERKYKCSSCPASFKSTNSLHGHRRACHSRGRVSCALCRRVYSCRHYALKHMRTVHGCEGPVHTVDVQT